MAVQVNDNGLTPAKTFSYDQLDRQASAAMEGVAAYRYVYNNQDQVTEEQITIPTSNGHLERSLIRSYDSHGRPTGYQLKNGDAVEQEITYAYAPAGQLARVTADGKEFTYSYLPNAPHFISRVTAPLHTVTHVYEANRDVLTGKTNCWKNKGNTPIISAYTYEVNSLGQRTYVSTEGEAFASVPADWAWGYDVLGQVTGANEDHYSYDQIGNRRTSRKGDAADTVYTANALNQYSRIGTTTPTHDADGNQLTGLTPIEGLPGRDTLTFTYNAENRPVQVSQNGEVRESYSYDHMGRRIHKGDTVTLYDGYNAIAEYKSHTRTLKTTYAWGNDLSGTAQGAGGVGGLLAVTEHDRQLPLTSYPCYDGNGNITEYLTEENGGTMVAHYEYDTFGQVVREIGEKSYNYQFSSKPYDSLTGYSYYNYRNYDLFSGRWGNQDPLEELGGFNLYCMIFNDTINHYDFIGLAFDTVHVGGATGGFSGQVAKDLIKSCAKGLTQIRQERAAAALAAAAAAEEAAKDAKKLTEKELAEASEEGDAHKIKDRIKNKHKGDLRKNGDTNGDIWKGKDETIFIKGNKSGKFINTGTKLKDWR